jgi:hypothetical protein
MKTAVILILVVYIIFVIVLFTWMKINIWLLRLEMYFLKLKIDNHPVLKTMVDDVLQKICNTEGIKVFHKTQDEMNANGNCDAVGLYIYTHNQDWVETAKQRLTKIIELEEEYKMPYKDICATIGRTTDVTREDFTLPRIILCEETLVGINGMNSYYGTYFHELGHHFIEKNGGIQSEDDADKMGQNLVQEHLPFFFQLLPTFRFEYRIKDIPELTRKEKFRAYWEYYQYYRKFKHTIIN